MHCWGSRHGGASSRGALAARPGEPAGIELAICVTPQRIIAMSAPGTASVRHLFVIHAPCDANVVARVFEPFVVSNVLPIRLSAGADREGSAYVLSLEFLASDRLAENLAAKLAAIVSVRLVDRSAVSVAAA